jgi:DNA-binding transcriptional LysR family regulator
MSLPLELLRYFVPVAEELHFGLAAQRLHMTQPPLSQRIRQLEDAVGVPLFKRSTRSVELTAAGQVMLVRARALLQAGDAAVRAASRAGTGDAGVLRLGFTSSAAYRVLPAAIARFTRAYPDVRLELREKVSLELADDLIAHRIDAALVRPMPGRDLVGFECEHVHGEPLVLALPRSHALARLASVPLKRLERERLIGFSQQGSPYFHDLLQQLFAGAGVRPETSVESVLPTILALVEAGLGLAVVPQSATVLRGRLLAYRPLAARRQPNADLEYLRRMGDDNPVTTNFAGCLTSVRAA